MGVLFYDFIIPKAEGRLSYGSLVTYKVHQKDRLLMMDFLPLLFE